MFKHWSCHTLHDYPRMVTYKRYYAYMVTLREAQLQAIIFAPPLRWTILIP